MRFSAFAPLSSGFGFSSKPPYSEAIYEALKSNFGETYETSFDGLQQARLYAQAMCVGAAQYQIDRAINNRKAETATELLPSIERDYQIVPSYSSSLDERRKIAAARALVTRGSRQEAVEDALRTLLGAAFIAYEPTATAALETFPAIPGDVGVFARSGTQKKVFSLGANVSRTEIPLTVPFTVIGGTDAPIAGETYCVDPDTRHPSIEKITISSVAGSSLVATFTKPHTVGALAVRPHPVWISSKRYSRVVVTFAAATDPETRRKINEQMKRQLRGVSQWCIVSNEGTFRFGHATRARLSATRLV